MRGCRVELAASLAHRRAMTWIAGRAHRQAALKRSPGARANFVVMISEYPRASTTPVWHKILTFRACAVVNGAHTRAPQLSATALGACSQASTDGACAVGRPSGGRGSVRAGLIC